jgi:hypothetical protein
MKIRLIVVFIFIVTESLYSQSAFNVYTEDEVRQTNRVNAVNGSYQEKQLVLKSRSVGSYTLMLGGGLNYLHGSDDKEFSFDPDLLGWDGEFMIGYTYYNYSGNDGASIGIFFRGGVLPYVSLEKLITEGGLVESLSSKDNNIFYNIEGGVLLGSFFRISTGLGFQEYESGSGDLRRIVYYSTTPGIMIGSGTIKLLVYLNLMYGRDLQQTIYKPGIGLILKL